MTRHHVEWVKSYYIIDKKSSYYRWCQTLKSPFNDAIALFVGWIEQQNAWSIRMWHLVLFWFRSFTWTVRLLFHSLLERVGGSFRIGRPRSRVWKHFGHRWTEGVGCLKNLTVFMDVICVSSLNLRNLREISFCNKFIHSQIWTWNHNL